MNFFDSLSISATGLSAQRLRMNLIASNMANVNTTRTSNGEPYRRKDVVFETISQKRFETVFNQQMEKEAGGVKAARIVEDQKPFVQKYDPDHPDADENGIVRLPNINIVEEMVNMISASRSFETNAMAVKSTKDLAMAALGIGRQS